MSKLQREPGRAEELGPYALAIFLCRLCGGRSTFCYGSEPGKNRVCILCLRKKQSRIFGFLKRNMSDRGRLWLLRQYHKIERRIFQQQIRKKKRMAYHH